MSKTQSKNRQSFGLTFGMFDRVLECTTFDEKYRFAVRAAIGSIILRKAIETRDLLKDIKDRLLERRMMSTADSSQFDRGKKVFIKKKFFFGPH